MMSVNYGVSSEASRNEAIKKLDDIAKRVEKAKATGGKVYNPSWHMAIDLRNLLTCSYLTVRASLKRKESRGGHTRSDFLEVNPSLQDVLYILKIDDTGNFTLTEETNEPISAELQAVLDKFEN